MTLSSAAAVKAEWSDRRGDDWDREWTRAAGTRVYDGATLVVQLRAGEDQSSRLLASTANGAGFDADRHALIDVSGSDFDGDPIVFAWSITAEDTARIPAGVDQVLEAQCEIDGKVATFHRHRWETLPQVAVEGS